MPRKAPRDNSHVGEFHFKYRGKRIAPKKHKPRMDFHGNEGPTYSVQEEARDIMKKAPEIIDQLKDVNVKLHNSEKELHRLSKERDEIVCKLTDEMKVRSAVITLLIPDLSKYIIRNIKKRNKLRLDNKAKI